MSEHQIILAGEKISADPATMGLYPPSFPIELALRVASVRRTCEAYGISHEEWMDIREDPVFKSDLTKACEMVRKEGMSFKLKARLQSEELLKTSWQMIHAPEGRVPATVRADLLKFTIRAAGLVEAGPGEGAGATNLQININLG